MIESMKLQFRQIETLGVPVVACLNGTALGGGWELALGCHHRIALQDKKAKFGLPEVTLGLLPGGGGIVRMVRLLGLQTAFPFLMEGKQFGVEQAVQLGLIHDTASSNEELLDKAKAWVKSNPKSQQPFDVKGYKIPVAIRKHLPLHKSLPLPLRCSVVKPKAVILRLKRSWQQPLKVHRSMSIPHYVSKVVILLSLPQVKYQRI